jgi:hypothetical protein
VVPSKFIITLNYDDLIGVAAEHQDRLVGRHAADADLPENRRSPHVLRHTFCTHLADSGADTAVIRELAGHADIRSGRDPAPDRLGPGAWASGPVLLVRHATMSGTRRTRSYRLYRGSRRRAAAAATPSSRRR